MAEIRGLTGDEAVAYAVKQCDVDVVSAYPITPQTIIVERFSEYVANGEVKTEFICVESEHSAMSACIGSSLTGARTFTATCSQGLALMHEMLYIASSLRLPIVMAVANRALSAPLNIHGDHSDMMGSRDCGWVQIYAENAQEVYDWIIQAFRLAEDPELSMPVAVNLDGFTITHCMEGVEVLEDEIVAKFLPPRKPLYTLDPSKPITVGAWATPEYYMDFKRQQVEALASAKAKLLEVTKEYAQFSGRKYGILESYGMEDAEAAVLCLGSTAGTVRAMVKELRARGEKVGIVKLWLYRPFPMEELMESLRGIKALAVMDRACSFGAPYGPLCSDVLATFQRYGLRIPTMNAIYGLGGRDVRPWDLSFLFDEVLKIARTGVVRNPVVFLGVRE
ncbi:pyruvate ferredoxin oxidoreductase [Candidatus Bathyarchaeota archaeon]|nr:pyruvate ferredoxin oxidoreductase [Candidatus Bathyarchaeota archaeon]MBS7628186.1 pyruvate ferredoxin oxidoreductase [Candidatus Bathyarchaeota archaeon]